MGEIVSGWPRYEVERDGTIRNILTGRELKQTKTPTGYPTVELFGDNGRHKRLTVHRLVAIAYVPNPNNYPCVNHKDESRDNNNADNLEWCTHKYNSNYGTAKERARKGLERFRRSEKCKEIGRNLGKSNCKPVLQFTRDGAFVAHYESALTAQREIGANNAHIIECCKGKRKTANGFVWKYEKED